MTPFLRLNSTATRIIRFLEDCTSPAHILQIQAQLIVHNLCSNSTVAYHFITACQSFSLLDSALILYTRLQSPHIFVWNNLIRAFSHSHLPHLSISTFAHIHKNSVLPNNYTFPFVLKSVSDLKHLRGGQSLHGHIVKLGHLCDIYVQNSLLNVYSSCGDMVTCRKVFDEMPQKDVVSWTVMITGYREAGKFDDALIAFEQMQYGGIVPNRVTMVNALAACANFGALEMGIWIHYFIKRSGWKLDVTLGTSLIDMYGKCGRIDDGLNVFKSMERKNAYTWNSLIKGLALAKSGEEAVKWFFRMQQEGVKPDEVTLVCVLCSCAHSALVQTGKQIFASLTDGKFGFSPAVKHYACMVDLLARCGHLQEAFQIIKEMPFEPTKSVWGALLTGSRTHGDIELSELAAWKLVELAPDKSANYVVLSNLYAEMGKWRDVEKVRILMKERGLKKDLGSSSVEPNSLEHISELLT